jgi:hypothetical protein
MDVRPVFFGVPLVSHAPSKKVAGSNLIEVIGFYSGIT